MVAPASRLGPTLSKSDGRPVLMYSMALVVSMSCCPLGALSPVASTPGVVVATAAVGEVPVMLLLLP